jgi:hypothetical protein
MGGSSALLDSGSTQGPGESPRRAILSQDDGRLAETAEKRVNYRYNSSHRGAQMYVCTTG